MFSTPYRTLALLERGRSSIEYKWSQGGGNCALNAVSPRRTDPWVTTFTASRALRNSLPGVRKFIPVIGRSVAFYNDQSVRTQQDILALYDRAIARKRRQVAIIDRVRSPLWRKPKVHQDAHRYTLKG